MEDDYWHEDLYAGPLLWREQTEGIGLLLVERAARLRIHVADEGPIRRRDDEIIPLPAGPQSRIYAQLRLYAPWPPLDVARDPEHGWGADRVPADETEETWRGFRPIELGTAQLWYYTADRILVFWELVLGKPYANFLRDEKDPGHDENWLRAYRSIEGWARGRFPGAKWIVAPAWEPEVGREAWLAALGRLGYAQFSRAAMLKGGPAVDEYAPTRVASEGATIRE